MLEILLLTSTPDGFTLVETGTGFLQGASLTLLLIEIQMYFKKSCKQRSNSKIILDYIFIL